jgi:hypothetical protein
LNLALGQFETYRRAVEVVAADGDLAAAITARLVQDYC